MTLICMYSPAVLRFRHCCLAARILQPSNRVWQCAVMVLSRVWSSVLCVPYPVLWRAGMVDVVLSYCHYCLNDTLLEDYLQYLQDKQVGN